MAKKLYEESSIQAIADSIRAKNGLTTKYKIADMGSAIQSLTGAPSGDSIQIQSGTMTLDSNADTIIIMPDLSVIHGIIVKLSRSNSTQSTLGWMYASIDDISMAETIYRSQYVTSYSTSNKVSIDDGVITLSPYGGDYPILAGTYKWIAF